jgi:hypothetical protein
VEVFDCAAVSEDMQEVQKAAAQATVDRLTIPFSEDLLLDDGTYDELCKRRCYGTLEPKQLLLTTKIVRDCGIQGEIDKDFYDKYVGQESRGATVHKAMLKFQKLLRRCGGNDGMGL